MEALFYSSSFSGPTEITLNIYVHWIPTRPSITKTPTTNAHVIGQFSDKRQNLFVSLKGCFFFLFRWLAARGLSFFFLFRFFFFFHGWPRWSFFFLHFLRLTAGGLSFLFSFSFFLTFFLFFCFYSISYSTFIFLLCLFIHFILSTLFFYVSNFYILAFQYFSLH